MLVACLFWNVCISVPYRSFVGSYHVFCVHELDNRSALRTVRWNARKKHTCTSLRARSLCSSALTSSFAAFHRWPSASALSAASRSAHDLRQQSKPKHLCHSMETGYTLFDAFQSEVKVHDHRTVRVWGSRRLLFETAYDVLILVDAAVDGARPFGRCKALDKGYVVLPNGLCGCEGAGHKRQ
jgi:hypothetical protein